MQEILQPGSASFWAHVGGEPPTPTSPVDPLDCHVFDDVATAVWLPSFEHKGKTFNTPPPSRRQFASDVAFAASWQVYAKVHFKHLPEAPRAPQGPGKNGRIPRVLS